MTPAPFLPMSRAEMDRLGWDACDVVLITGDAYIDHPSFGAALIGRLWESLGYRVDPWCNRYLWDCRPVQNHTGRLVRD